MSEKPSGNLLVFKFSLTLGGGERFSFILGKKFKAMGYRVRFYSNFIPFLKKIRSLGVSAKRLYWGQEVGARRYLPQYFFLLPINLLRFFFILLFNKRIGKRNIVVFQGLNEKVFATSMAKLLGYRVFWVEHLSIRPWLTKSFLRGLYIRRATRVDKIIVVSESIKEELVSDLGIPGDKIAVVYNGVDLDEFHVLDQKNVENEKKKFGFFKGSKIIGYDGRLHEEKGLNILIDAFYQVSRRFDHLYLLLLGDGSERKKLELQVSRLGIEKKVLFLGYREDVPLFLNLIDIFVLPSIARESFGISIIEAMACGKVVIASNLGGIPEIISNEADGLLFNPGSEKELADLLSKALSDDAMVKEMEGKALKKVKKYFSVDVMINKLEEIFLK